MNMCICILVGAVYRHVWVPEYYLHVFAYTDMDIGTFLLMHLSVLCDRGREEDLAWGECEHAYEIYLHGIYYINVPLCVPPFLHWNFTNRMLNLVSSF